MSKLIRKLNFRQAAEILGIELDDVRALVVEERRIPAVYVTHLGYSEPYTNQILKVDAEGRAFDLSVGGINGTVHTGYLRIERDALERFMLDEGLSLPQIPAAGKAEGSSEAVELAAEQTPPSESVQAVQADAPDPLTTSDIAHCFNDLKWTEQEWKKALGDKPKWLQTCVATPGQRGVLETRWNPVLICAALVHNGHATPQKVRKRFQNMPQLSAWLEAWKTYEADYLDTE